MVGNYKTNFYFILHKNSKSFRIKKEEEEESIDTNSRKSKTELE